MATTTSALDALRNEQRRNACRCPQPIRNAHMKPVDDRPRCARCLRPMMGDQLVRAKYPHELPGKPGTSAHRQARVEKFNAAQRKKAEKRKRGKRR
jgi:hypothetical protein